MKKYQIIYADPPWKYKCKNPPSSSGRPDCCSVEYYYKTMSHGELKDMPVKTLASDNSVLFLWVTVPFINEGLDLMRHWGFSYKTMLTWEKTNKDCMGYYFRVCTEHLLVGVKGKVRAFRSMQRTLYSSPRGKHSQKPEFFRTLIDSLGFNDKVELFARQKTPGWDVWGNEVENDIELKTTPEGVEME